MTGYLDPVSTLPKAGRPVTAALLAAAGTGERLGRGPKAFISLAGKTLLERAVAALAPLVDEIVIAVPEGELERGRLQAPHARLILGGATRQESVFALLESTSADLVLVHDVARPFLGGEVGARVLAAAARHGAATAARQVPDTLVTTAEGVTVARDELRAVQTPQAFRRELLVRAHRAALREARSATDDASLVRATGAAVELVEGSPWLIKLTTPDDFEFAEALARAWDDD